jgi:membrane-associated phospholipid phosphatase
VPFVPFVSFVSPSRELLAWPGWKHIREAVWLGLLFWIWLELVYVVTDVLTGARTFRVRLHFDWELSIPFVPGMTVFYMSIFPLMWLAPFALRTRGELRGLMGSLSRVTLSAGIVFLLLPAQLGYAPEVVPPRWASLYDFADAVNLHYNLAPSLHVALAVTCVDSYTRRASSAARFILWTWGATIALSTLLTHQHHLLDVLSGFALAMTVSRWPAWRTAMNRKHNGSTADAVGYALALSPTHDNSALAEERSQSQ